MVKNCLRTENRDERDANGRRGEEKGRTPSENELVALGRDNLLLGGELEEVCDRLEEAIGSGHYRAPPSLHAGVCLPVQPLEGEGDPDKEGQPRKEEEFDDLKWVQLSFLL